MIKAFRFNILQFSFSMPEKAKCKYIKKVVLIDELIKICLYTKN